MIAARFIALLTGLALLFPTARALADSYKYVDKDGTVHYTDNPYELPEPQRTKVLRQLERERKQREQDNLNQPAPLPDGARDDKLPQGPVVPAVGPSHKDGQAKPEVTKPNEDGEGVSKGGEGVWRAAYRQAKAELAGIEAKCRQFESDRDQNRRKSLMLATPGSNQAANEAARDLETCQKELEQARTYLEEGLPAKARKAGVPVRWVSE